VKGKEEMGDGEWSMGDGADRKRCDQAKTRFEEMNEPFFASLGFFQHSLPGVIADAHGFFLQ
jgi:hypothetical protein